MTDQRALDAGRLSTWVLRIERAQVDGAGVDVPCGTCTACCRSSYFIHIGADETETLRHIPKALLFPAPGLPKGNVVMGYDERGHCPMLVDDRCSIYAYRPRTCRNFDCRIFPATGLSPGGAEKASITEQAARWTFDLPTPEDRAQQAAIHAAAAYLQGHPACFPDGMIPTNSAVVAFLAIKVHRLFLSGAEPDIETITAALRE